MNIEIVRQEFERVAVPNFFIGEVDLARDSKGQYIASSLEDHWQTFQEGWGSAVAAIKSRVNLDYSDLVSDSGFDPRDRTIG